MGGVSHSKFTKALDTIHSKYKEDINYRNNQLLEYKTIVEKLHKELNDLKNKNNIANKQLQLALIKNSDIQRLINKEYNYTSIVDEFIKDNNIQWMNDDIEKDWLFTFTTFLEKTHLDNLRKLINEINEIFCDEHDKHLNDKVENSDRYCDLNEMYEINIK